MSAVVGHEVECESYHMLLQEDAQGGSILARRVEKGHHHGAAAQHARIGSRESRQMQHDVAGHGVAPLHNLHALRGVGRVGVMDARGCSGLHPQPEASGHKGPGSFGCERKTALGHAFAGRQAYRYGPGRGGHGQ